MPARLDHKRTAVDGKVDFAALSRVILAWARHGVWSREDCTLWVEQGNMRGTTLPCVPSLPFWVCF